MLLLFKTFTTKTVNRINRLIRIKVAVTEKHFVIPHEDIFLQSRKTCICFLNLPLHPKFGLFVTFIVKTCCFNGQLISKFGDGCIEIGELRVI